MNKALKNDMNTTTIKFPRITTLACVQTSRPTATSPRPVLCRDAINRELVRCANGRGQTSPGPWERWLFIPLVAVSFLAVMTVVAAAGSWIDQWPMVRDPQLFYRN